MKAGTSTQVITPPVGTSLAGYFHDRVSTGVHDDLLAKALVLDNGRKKVAIVVCDLLWIQGEQVRRVRELALKAAGIPPENIMISCTHTHTGPETRVKRPMVPINEAYIERLPQLIADSIIRAEANLQPAVIRLGEEFEDRLSFNRRFLMKDGSVAFNPGKMNPDIIGPVGPTDPQLNVLRVDHEDGSPMAIIANFSMHPDVMTGCEISADFPGESSRLLSSFYESKPMVMYMQGACGNLNQIDVSSSTNQNGPKEVMRLSRILAGKSLAASELSQPMSCEDLGSISRELGIKYHPLTEELKTKAEETRKKAKPNDFEKAQAELIASYELDGKTAAVEVQAIRIGDTAVVGVPGEYFVEYGLNIKQWSPFDQTFIAELANAAFGYIPTLDAFYPGTYETMPILSATLEPSAGVQIANEAGKMLRELAD